MNNVLFEDSDILVYSKPHGTLSELSDSPISLPKMICDERQKNGEKLTLYPIHRLDKEVSGAILFAKTQSAARALSEAVARGELKKTYLAVIEGIPEKESDTLIDLLFKDSSKNKSFVVKRERRGVKKAILSYSLISSRNDTSLVKIELMTGRTHQIRVQFSSRGHSVVGDRKYGSKQTSPAITLCCHTLELVHPKTNERLSIRYIPKDTMWDTYEDDLKKLH